jgi:2-polyprenyl-3-methyl-5-hydroxy-6-metoxy-1,4-benzoquinol methylase
MNKMNIEDFFNCPNCNGDLNPVHQRYQCINCSKSFDYKDGILSLLPEGTHSDFSNIPLPDELYQKAKKLGWETAAIEHVRYYLNPIDYLSYAHKQIISEAPGDFQYLLPINKESIVLLFGVGWGNIAAAVARNSKYVYVLDANVDLLHFSVLRFQDERLSNTRFIQSSSCSFPVKENCFDTIVLYGNLEQMACERSNTSHDQMVTEFLSKVKSALKPDGILYIATENRFSFHYFTGKKEIRSNLRFVTLLPCRIVNYYLRMRGSINYQCNYYSKNNLKNKIVKSGFVKPVFYYPIPSIKNLRYMSELEDRAVFKYLLKMVSSSPRFSLFHSAVGYFLSMVPMSIIKFFWPDFCVVAKRP